MFPATLVQYQSPLKARSHSTKASIEAIRRKADTMVPVDTEELMKMGTNDILDTLLPPKIAEDDDGFWYQKISRAPASSSDLMRLQKELDAELMRREAREIGVCPIRNELYDQCLEELIRQECVVCPERGRLLRMIHQEAKLSLRSAMEGYESALAYGIKKTLMSAKETTRLTSEVTDFLGKVSRLDDVRQGLELRLPIVKGECDNRENGRKEALDAEEKKIERENEVMLKQMMDYVDINLETER